MWWFPPRFSAVSENIVLSGSHMLIFQPISVSQNWKMFVPLPIPIPYSHQHRLPSLGPEVVDVVHHTTQKKCNNGHKENNEIGEWQYRRLVYRVWYGVFHETKK